MNSIRQFWTELKDVGVSKLRIGSSLHANSQFRYAEEYVTTVEEHVINFLHGYGFKSAATSRFATEMRIKRFRRNILFAGAIFLLLVIPLSLSIAFLFLRVPQSSFTCPAGTSWSGIKCLQCDSVKWSHANSAFCKMPDVMLESSRNDPTLPYLQCGLPSAPVECPYRFSDPDNVESIATTLCRGQVGQTGYEYDYGRLQEVLIPITPAASAPDFVITSQSSFAWDSTVTEWAKGQMYRAVVFCYSLCPVDKMLDVESMKCLDSPQNILYTQTRNPTVSERIYNSYHYYQSTSLFSGQPTVILIHGGSFHGADKRDYVKVGQWFNKAGFPTAIVNYRQLDYLRTIDKRGLTPAKSIYESVEDIAQAVKEVRDRVKGEVLLVGHGAGVYLTSMLLSNATLLQQSTLVSGTNANSIFGVLFLGGVYNVTDAALNPGAPSGLHEMASQIIFTNPDIDSIFRLTDPDTISHFKDVPIALVPAQMENPDSVYGRQSTAAAAKMKAAGFNNVDVLELDGYESQIQDPLKLAPFLDLLYGIDSNEAISVAYKSWLNSILPKTVRIEMDAFD
ncbi:Alpha/beta hydrolase family [Carpediemonas membranifera]|uniref:Alpha/beta hydrolase family n=1 Tax=Carpediemonas membranifera TaxID=201153 RepID=A0A8J6B563_9EUKA|nr:Alpha/beta hydrolase family [Carpediemonas membranifera]|eukprot:KAG9394519.1 Alpha/beta hydrolase family [Carpediemonas membranifera]